MTLLSFTLLQQRSSNTPGDGSGVIDWSFEQDEQWDVQAAEDSGVGLESNNNNNCSNVGNEAAAVGGRRSACAGRQSKADTLRDAIHYIRQLEQMLNRV